ncbi:MAG TPA: hypothetical protein VFC19_22095 [Candidatus Limnocylindrales bacterium]|nr:hypothetical protein [Candidatus Limnocylindrales bacterium]
MKTGNRVLWTAIGLILTAAGVAGLLINLDRLPGTDRGQPVIWPELVEQGRSWRPWLLAGVIVLGLLLALLGALLLRAQLRRRGGASMSDLRFDSADEHGQTVVGTRVMVKGLAHDLENQVGVSRAAVHLGGDTGRPNLRLWLTVEPGTHLDRVQYQVLEVLRRFTTTTSLTPGDVTVDTKVAGLQRSRLTAVK